MLVVFWSCTKETSKQEEDDVDEILSIVLGDTAVSVDGLDDGGAQDTTYDSNSGKVAVFGRGHYRFGRRIDSVKVDPVVEFIGEDTAIVTLNRELFGMFIIVTLDSNNVPVDTTEKDMHIYSVQKIRVVKREYKVKTGRRWRIDMVSMFRAWSENSDVDIQWLEVKKPNGQTVHYDNPDSIMIGRFENMMTFRWNQIVGGFVYIDNPDTSGTRVMLHYGARGRFKKARRPFNDRGIFPDAVEGDGIFSGAWTIHRGRGIFHAFVDVLDNETIVNPDAPYNSVVWGFPYRVIP
jgi:hypothetical protein